MEESSILHIDGDNFFAELLRLKNPKLRKRPVIVGHLKSRGAVVAASYEARHAGIVPGITMQQASRLCPDAALEQINWELVNKATAVLNNLLAEYSPAVEPVGADAAFLDYTGCHYLFGPAKDFARKLQKKIYDQMSITASIGLSPDKAVSAVACRAAKMGSFQSVEPGEESLFLAECPLIWLPGIDNRLNQYFTQLGVTTIGGIAQIPVDLLEHLLGHLGRVLSLRARGCEHASVRLPSRIPKAIKQERFAEDQVHPKGILARVAGVASRLGHALRKRHQSARTLSLSLDYIDGRIQNRQMYLRPPTNRDHELFTSARELFIRSYTRRVRLRRVELKAIHVEVSLPELPMGEAALRVKWDHVLAAADKARTRYNSEAIQIGAVLDQPGRAVTL